MGVAVKKNVYSPFRSIFTLYTTVLVIIAIITSMYMVFFRNVTTVINTAKRNQSEAYLATIVKDFNDSMRVAEMACLELYLDERIRYFLNKEITDDDIQVKEIQDIINQKMIKNDNINSIYVYYKKQDMVITKKSIIDFKDFENKKWKEYGSPNFGTRIVTPAWVLSDPDFNYNKIGVVSIIRYFPVYSSDNMGAVVVNVDISEIQRELFNLDKKEKSSSFLVNSVGIIQASGNGSYSNGSIYNLLGKNFNMDSLDEKTVRFGNTSSMVYTSGKTYFKWRVLQVYPAKNLRSNYSILYVYFTASILLCIIALIFTIRFGIRIRKINLVNGKQVNSVVDLLDKQNKVFLYGLLCTLLNNNDALSQEQMNNLERLGLPTAGYVVLLVKKVKDMDRKPTESQYPEITEVLDSINEGISNYTSGYCINTNSSEFIVVLNITEDYIASDETRKILTDFSEYLLNLLKKIYKCNFGIIAGKYVELLEQIGISLNAAKAKERYLWLHSSDCIVFSEEHDECNIKYIYNTETEAKLIESIKAVNEHEAEKLLNLFIDTLKAENHFSPPNVYQGMLQMTCSIVKTFQSIISDQKACQNNRPEFVDSIVIDFMNIETLHSAHIFLSDTIKRICDYLWEIRGTSSIENIVSHAKDYILRNLNKSLTLSSVAGEFRVSESYFSRIFKQKTGENYLEFLNKSRINKAKEILTDTNTSISDVSSMVGFENVQTFIRVFKGFEGITPGAYKDLLRKDDSNSK